jgi:hypothetical protein
MHDAGFADRDKKLYSPYPPLKKRKNGPPTVPERKEKDKAERLGHPPMLVKRLGARFKD